MNIPNVFDDRNLLQSPTFCMTSSPTQVTVSIVRSSNHLRSTPLSKRRLSSQRSSTSLPKSHEMVTKWSTAKSRSFASSAGLSSIMSSERKSSTSQSSRHLPSSCESREATLHSIVESSKPLSCPLCCSHRSETLSKDSGAQPNFCHPKVTRALAPRGGSGASVLACDINGLQCAMKDFKIDKKAEQQVAIAKLKNEIDVLKRLSHPNIIRYLSHFISQHRIQIFMTRYESTLRREIRTKEFEIKNDISDPFDVGEMRLVLKDIASGLEYLHTNQIMHRDLKTDNIYLTFHEDGIIQNAVIGDFDTAKQCSPKQMTSKSVVGNYYRLLVLIIHSNLTAGTINYMAPEVIALALSNTGNQTFRSNERGGDFRSSANDPTQRDCLDGYTFKVDLWSYGMIIYELLTLQLPYTNIPIVEASRMIECGIQPPLPPSKDSFLSKEIIGKYARLVDIYHKCALHDPNSRILAPKILHLLSQIDS
jgi:serine/threonine protein kinase